jgi:hypothetical protein
LKIDGEKAQDYRTYFGCPACAFSFIGMYCLMLNHICVILWKRVCQ